jgi:hypothetical protein
MARETLNIRILAMSSSLLQLFDAQKNSPTIAYHWEPIELIENWQK